MVRITVRYAVVPAVAAALLAGTGVGCVSGRIDTGRHDPAAGTDNVADVGREPGSPGEHDDLAGWYRIEGGDTLIPVFQVDGEWFSACNGWEIPFRECDGGIEWALAPSSMTGTKIGRDADGIFIEIHDAQTANFSDGRYGIGERQALERVDPPAGLPEAIAPPPRSLDEMLGAYLPVWMPYVVLTIRKEDGRYVSIESEPPAGPDHVVEGDRYDLTPLPGRLGFSGFDRAGRVRLVYDEAHRRYLLASADPGVPIGSEPRGMPVARIDEETAGTWNPPPQVRIGIPSWH